MKIFFCNVGLQRFCLKKLLDFALKRLGQPYKELEMSLSVVSPEEIRELNKRYRNVDAVTDVLSFPTLENPERKILQSGAFGIDSVNPESGKFNIGDVVICMERVKEQAESYGHGVKRELAFLSLHGLLHLLGYDHETEADEEQMTALQNEILEAFGITR